MNAHDHLRRASEIIAEALAEAHVHDLGCMSDRLLEANAAIWRARWEFGLLPDDDEEQEAAE
jgi:hypothetical protein